MQTVYLMKFCENKKIKSCKQVINQDQKNEKAP